MFKTLKSRMVPLGVVMGIFATVIGCSGPYVDPNGYFTIEFPDVYNFEWYGEDVAHAYDADGWFSEMESDPEGYWEVIMRASGVQYNDQDAPIQKTWVVAQFSVVLFPEEHAGLALAGITDQEWLSLEMEYISERPYGPNLEVNTRMNSGLPYIEGEWTGGRTTSFYSVRVIERTYKVGNELLVIECLMDSNYPGSICRDAIDALEVHLPE